MDRGGAAPPRARPRRSTRIAFLLLGAAAFGVAAPRAVRAAEATIDEVEAEKRLERLRKRLLEYCKLRAELVEDCRTCRGKGKLRVRYGYRDCRTCDAIGRVRHRLNFRALHFEMKTPTYRKSPGAEAEAEALWKGATLASLDAQTLREYTLKDVRLLDDTHAVTEILPAGAREPEVIRWVWATDHSLAGGSWYLWAETTDGAWPGADAAFVPRPAFRPLSDGQKRDVEKALSKERLRHAVVSLQRQKETLVARLQPVRAVDAESGDKWMREDAIAVALATFGALKDWKALRLEFLESPGPAGASRDPKVVRTLFLDRETYEREGFAASPDPYALFRAEGSASTGPVPAADTPLAPVTPTVDEAVRRALAPLSLRSEVRRVGRIGDLLVVETKAKPPHTDESAVHADALSIAKTLLPLLPEWTGVRLAFGRSWRDSFGVVETRPWIVATLERRTYERLVLANLTPSEVFEHFHVERPTHVGFVPWDR